MCSAIRPLLAAIIFSAALLSAGCSSAAVEPPEDTVATPLPLLESGFTVGTTLYGSAQLPSAGTPARTLLDDAVARGMNGFTYYVDWPDLEPSPGQYDLGAFTATLDALQDLGVQPFVNITVGDIGDYNLPADLSDGEGGLAVGVALDDPAVIERFGGLLDRVVPLVVEHGGFLLGVGNEVDDRLDGEHANERDAYVRFAEAARERVHAIEPRLAIGVTLTNRAIRNRTATFRAFRAVTDIVPFNHAPIGGDLFVLGLDRVRDDFREVIAAYGEGPLVIQELTCPDAASMSASTAWQRGCFERLFEVAAETPALRFASVFTFQDFDTPTCEAVREALIGDEQLPEAYSQRLADYLCGLGVVTAEGAPKPAWDIIVAAAD